MTGTPERSGISLGFVSPLPPVRSGIADYSFELLSALDRRLEVTRYRPDEAARAFGQKHDVVILQIGNDPLHAPSVEALAARDRRIPAIVVLHDFVLHHLFAAAYLDRGRKEDYARELVRAHGDRGKALADRNLSSAPVPVWDLDPWSYPMCRGVLGDADAVIVHSRLVRGAALRESPGAHVVEIPHHVFPAPRAPRDEARRRLGLPPDRPVVATLGVVTPAKRVGKIIEALSRFPDERRPFLFVGGAVGPDDPLLAMVTSLGLEGDIAFGGYLSEEDFWMAASAADIAVNLRHPTMGETSGAVCRLAGFGLPMIVSDVGWFRELPDSFASKIRVGEGEAERLFAEISRIAYDEAEGRSRAEAARAWGAARSPDHVAERYHRVIEDLVEGRHAARGLVSLLSAGLHDLGVGMPGSYGSTNREPDATLVAEVALGARGLLSGATKGERGRAGPRPAR